MKLNDLNRRQSGRTIQNPCVRNCCLDENDICLGCHRTLSEILSWSSASSLEKQKILVNCTVRKSARKPRL
ncbi:DUF1289 domain-containing protein [Vibrio aestuarianus]|uniref:DUF1289 domain-containing protein n=1 Tax=Vibrio aestuarianus TaxID=28171 RepID=UPI00237CC1E6|nr:DUF1289 domain-containing protein [Vibrio aestuarianus]MDE1251258.1 DUF1289 domain-containing protein [Vibrio aestuarianus]